MSAELFLGVAGGGTHSTGVLADASLTVLARGESGPMNVHTVGSQAAGGAAMVLLADLLTQAGAARSAIAASAFCLAGVRSEADQEVWQRIVATLGLGGVVVVTHDGAVGIAAGSPSHSGILVTCGTGSLVYGRRADGAERFAIGRGLVLGDEGSGFDIGQRGLRAVVRAADGRGAPTLLEQLVRERLGIASIGDLVTWVTPFDKKRIATVAPLVFEAAAAGDPVAEAIVSNALAELALGVKAVAEALWPGAEKPDHVLLTGGVVCHQPAFREGLAAAIHEFLPGVPCGEPEAEGALGAARVAHLAWAESQGAR